MMFFRAGSRFSVFRPELARLIRTIGIGLVALGCGFAQAQAASGKIYAIAGYGPLTPGGSAYYPLARLEVFDPATNTWTTGASLNTARTFPGAATAANGKIYVAGGVSNEYPTTRYASLEEYDPAANTWTVRAPMAAAREYLTMVAAADGRIYAIGGITSAGVVGTVEQYDPATNVWTTKSPMPTPRFGHAAATATNGRIYVVGGRNSSGNTIDVVEEYDPATDRWTTRTPVPAARTDFAMAAAPNGRLYAAGGFGVSGGPSPAYTLVEYNPAADTWANKASSLQLGVYLGDVNQALAASDNGRLYSVAGQSSEGRVGEYDPATNTWALKASLPGGTRYGLVAVGTPPMRMVDGPALVAAGGYANGLIINRVEMFDPASNTWSGRAAMTSNRNYHGVATTADGAVYAMGGYTAPGQATNSLEKYDPATRTWTTKTPMPTTRLALGVATGADGKLYAAGGMTAGGTYLATLEVYDPKTDTWDTTRAAMPSARGYLALIAATNGKLYAVGGSDSGGITGRVEEYDPATNAWTTKASLATPRRALGLAAASNGKIYAAGGYGSSGFYSSVEEYDPVADTWTTKAPMSVARGWPALVGTRNGRVYAAGGTGDGSNQLGSAEEYDPATDTWNAKADLPGGPRYGLVGAATQLYADLAVTMSDSPDPVIAGNNLTYTIGVTNNGPDPASLATFTDPLPAGATFVSIDAPSGWTCTTPDVGSNGTVSCTNPALAVGSGSFTLVARVDPARTTTQSNTATVSSAAVDVTSANNSATGSTDVQISTDLSISIAANANAVAGEQVSYAISIVNAGPSATANNVFDDILPAGATFVSLTSSAGWSCSTPAVNANGTVSCSNPSFAPGTASFTLVARLNTATGFTNTASVSTTTTETSTGNNSASATTTVSASGTSASLGVSPSPSALGQTATLTATVTPNAPSAGVPTGTVTFSDGAATLGTGTLNASGVATFLASGLSVGPHTLNASYAGDGNYLPSSTSAAHTVSKSDSTVTVLSSLNPSSYGQGVSFRARVIGVTGRATPTGNVTFADSLGGDLGPTSLTSTYVVQIASGSGHTCVLDNHGTVSCVGDNSYGQSGGSTMGSGAQISVLQPITSLPPITRIVAGVVHTCALSQAGGMYCWGSNYNGQLGYGGPIGSGGDRYQPQAVLDPTGTAPLTGITAIGSAENTICASTSSALYCWGYSGQGQVGSGSTSNAVALPQQVSGLASATNIVGGSGFMCALSGGNVYCWGTGNAGQLGLGNTTSSPTPQLVPGLSNVSRISSGTYHACAIAGGAAYCWGRNNYGAVGDGTTTDRSSPTAVGGLGAVTEIAGGFATSCAMAASGAVWCWGLGQYGTIGDGTTANRLTPVSVVGLPAGNTGLFGSTGGGAQMLVVTADGGVMGWGDNSSGQLGNGTTTSPQTTPAAMLNASYSSLSFSTSSLVAGTHGITATYVGDGNFNGATSAVLSQVVNGTPTTTSVTASAASVMYGTAVTFTASVSASSATPAGTVQFAVDGAHLGSPVAVSNGVATYQTAALGVAGSPHAITATFIPSDPSFEVSSGSLSGGVSVTQNTTTAALAASPTTTLLGGAVTLTATVTPASGAGPFAGTVTFYDGAAALGSAAPDGSGVATLSTSALGAGVHALTASYGGDANYAGATSGAVSVTVLQPTTVTLASAPAASGRLGESVTLTASVSAASGTPAGTVTFRDGSGVLGTASLTSGSASLATSALALGAHSFTAEYGASGLFAGSTSAALAFTVTRAAVAVALMSSVDPSIYGQSVTFTSTVTPAKLGPPTGTITFSDTTGDLAMVAIGTSVDASLSSVAIGRGGYTPCSIDGTGALQCWGYSNYGQLGDGTTTTRLKPVTVIASGVTAVGGGLSFNCAVVSGAVQCWGRNNFGQLGDGTYNNRSTPDAGPIVDDPTAIGSGQGHSCVLTRSGAVQCWGYNISGQLGNGTYNDSLTAVTPLAGGVAAMTVGYNHTCALLSTGAAQCWGYNGYGQLGDGTYNDRNTPFTLFPSGVTKIATGGFHTCAIVSGALQCWGRNDYGQLGNGTTTQSSTPQTIIASGVTDVAASYYHTCAVVSGALQCWGRNDYGQLGDGTTTQRSSPVAVSGMESGVTSLALGIYHSCALVSGTVQCWGNNSNGQLGINSQTVQSAVPVATVGLTRGTASFSSSAYDVGSHAITASYSGDGSFGPGSDALSQTVNPAPTTTGVTVGSPHAVYGTQVTFTASVASGAGAPDGSAQIYANGVAVCQATVTNGAGSCQSSALAVGPYTLTASFTPSSGNYEASSSSGLSNGSLTVDQATTATAITGVSPSPATFGDSVTVTAAVSIATGAGTPTGTVAFHAGASLLGSGTVDGSGIASVSFTPPAGSLSLTASYSGDASFAASATAATTTLAIGKAVPAAALALSASSSVSGESVTLTASFASAAGTPTGTVTFRDGTTTLGTRTLTAGAASLTTSALATGPHTLIADYGGDASFATASTAAHALSVGRAATTTALVPGAATVFGQSATLTATVSVTAPGGGTPSGTVSFYDGAALLGSATLNGSGVASFATAALGTGSHSMSARYNVSTDHDASTSPPVTFSVGKGATATAVASSVPSSVTGQGVSFTATVSATAPAAGTPTGTVTFTIDGTPQPPATLANGVATLARADLAVGGHAVTAAYSADGNFNASTSAALTQTVGKGSTTTSLVSSAAASGPFGTSVTFTAGVSAISPAAGTPAGTVTFKDGTTTLGTGTLNGGTATFTTSSLGVGSHSITASYAGDGSFNASTSAGLGQTVTKIATTTALLSSANPSQNGQSITLTANVGAAFGSASPTGSVTFLDGPTVVGTGALASGTANVATTSLATTSLAPGGHSLTARFEGSADHSASTSAALLQTVATSCSDMFGDAFTISGPSGTLLGSNATATAESGEPSHAGVSGPARSVWCAWTAPADGTVAIDTSGSGFDTALAVYTGASLAGLSVIAASDNISASVSQSRVVFAAAAGTTYKIAIDGKAGASGPYVVSWALTGSATTLAAAVLPTSRSVLTGTPATAFASVINTGSLAASQCYLALPPGFPATFAYQTTNAVNVPVGTLNTPVDIPAGSFQPFVFAVTPTLDLDASAIPLTFACANATPAATIAGVNTFTLTASPLPSPDLIAIGATVSGDGIVAVPVGGTMPFVVAAVNIGAAGTITASVDDNGAGLPLIVTLCKSDPATALCIGGGAPSSAVTLDLGAGEVVTYTVYVQAAGPVAFDPAGHRLQLRLATPDTISRGGTSVAVTTTNTTQITHAAQASQ